MLAEVFTLFVKHRLIPVFFDCMLLINDERNTYVYLLTFR